MLLSKITQSQDQTQDIIQCMFLSIFSAERVLKEPSSNKQTSQGFGQPVQTLKSRFVYLLSK